MWRQLQRVAIPVFSGDKRKYENWKAAFLACIDRAPATPEYKLLQLRQYLSGVALKAIKNLGLELHMKLQRTGWSENLVARGGKLQSIWRTWTTSNQ